MALLLVSREGEGVWNPKLVPGELNIGGDFCVFFLSDNVIGEPPGLLAMLGSAVGTSRGWAPLVVGVMVGRCRFFFMLSGIIVGKCMAERSALVGTCSAVDSWSTFFLASSASSLIDATISFPESGTPETPL